MIKKYHISFLLKDRNQDVTKQLQSLGFDGWFFPDWEMDYDFAMYKKLESSKIDKLEEKINNTELFDGVFFLPGDWEEERFEKQ